MPHGQKKCIQCGCVRNNGFRNIGEIFPNIFPGAHTMCVCVCVCTCRNYLLYFFPLLSLPLLVFCWKNAKEAAKEAQEAREARDAGGSSSKTSQNNLAGIWLEFSAGRRLCCWLFVDVFSAGLLALINCRVEVEVGVCGVWETSQPS